MKKALIIDDERLARSELKKLLTDFPEIEVVGEAVNAKDGEEKIAALQPDLLFLDIQMPDKTGFELLASLEKVPQVIFTTAYDEYALKAFEYNALDYLMKPVEPKRLADALQKLQQQEEKERLVQQNRGKLSEADQVFVKDGDRCWFVKLQDIRLFESVGNYARVYFEQNKPLILKSLNALEERLDERTFFRANRKHIVNLRHIEKIDTYFNGGLLLEMQGGEKIEVSRRQAVRFREMMSL
ncbi:LytR/AlgR family response regulator transcription factor [Compostibacter hankyongensis]|uniref:LytTR family DNA-binding domain-containing protein n=1 Tax=Compostibacter hankyongensis TaxID=1007089 RepID=A0ABP8FI03_9BACT